MGAIIHRGVSHFVHNTVATYFFVCDALKTMNIIGTSARTVRVAPYFWRCN